MGLDMYLTEKVYIGANNIFERKDYQPRGEIEIKKWNSTVKINLDEVHIIELAKGYWRNAHQIHRWFVENVQDGEDDCKNYYVSCDQLKELLENCRIVQKNHKLAEEILPTQDDSYFDDAGYNEYYFKNIDNTIKILEGLDLENPEGDYYYLSSW